MDNSVDAQQNMLISHEQIKSFLLALSEKMNRYRSVVVMKYCSKEQIWEEMDGFRAFVAQWFECPSLYHDDHQYVGFLQQLAQYISLDHPKHFLVIEEAFNKKSWRSVVYSKI